MATVPIGCGKRTSSARASSAAVGEVDDLPAIYAWRLVRRNWGRSLSGPGGAGTRSRSCPIPPACSTARLCKLSVPRSSSSSIQITAVPCSLMRLGEHAGAREPLQGARIRNPRRQTDIGPQPVLEDQTQAEIAPPCFVVPECAVTPRSGVPVSLMSAPDTSELRLGVEPPGAEAWEGTRMMSAKSTRLPSAVVIQRLLRCICRRRAGPVQ